MEIVKYLEIFFLSNCLEWSNLELFQSKQDGWDIHLRVFYLFSFHCIFGGVTHYIIDFHALHLFDKHLAYKHIGAENVHMLSISLARRKP